MTGPLTDHGDGSYSDSVLLEDLNYVGADVSISTRLKRKKREFLASQTIEIYAALGCDDGLDNDGDSLIDVDDPGCTSPADPTETDAALVCDDGADNDGDALIDTADPGCSDALDRSEGLALLASESHCAAEQMKRGAQFCEAAFSCWRRYVRNPAKNRLNACLAKREATFASRHGKAIRKAAGRGRRCRLEDPVTYFLDAAFVQPMQAILHDIIGASMPARISPHEATLRATVLDAAGRLCAQRLQAESGQATKPRRARIESRRKKARERFESQVAKALRKAAKKGVPEPQMDPQMIGDAAERMADAFAEEVRAVESGD